MRGKRNQEEDQLIGCLNLECDCVQRKTVHFADEEMKKLCVNTREDQQWRYLMMKNWRKERSFVMHTK